jgi:transposase
MRGQDTSQDCFFSYGSLEERIPQAHPLRPVRTVVDEALKRLSRHFARLYASFGRRPSIAPEKLLRALLLMILYSVRSERRLIEKLEYNLLYRWFVGLGIDEPVWDASTFSKNRERFIDGEVARRFFDQVPPEARQRNLVRPLYVGQREFCSRLCIDQAALRPTASMSLLRSSAIRW